jgi:hypothetical protein
MDLIVFDLRFWSCLKRNGAMLAISGVSAVIDFFPRVRLLTVLLFHLVDRVQWDVEIDYHPTTDALWGDRTATDVNSSEEGGTTYINFAILLDDGCTPKLEVTFSQSVGDSFLPLGELVAESRGISIKMTPTYYVYLPRQILSNEAKALCKHFSIDPQIVLIDWLDESCHPFKVYPEPKLPLHWERKISSDGSSYFIDTKTLETSPSPSVTMSRSMSSRICSLFSMYSVLG